MAESEASKMNLAALKRVDSSISSILDNASQVALYKFISETQEWEKTEIEGTLFVYMRSQKPQHGFIVMNRLSMTNLVEPITEDLDFQAQSPFLLYRNGKGYIYGIWFYEKKNCTKIGKLLTSLSQLPVTKQEMNNIRQRSFSESNRKQKKQDNAQSDIMSLLSRAQDEYDKRSAAHDSTPRSSKNQKPTSSSEIIKPTPVRMNGVVDDVAPLSLGMLFAEVGVRNGKTTSTATATSGDDFSRRLRSFISYNGETTRPNFNSETILQSLLSNPAHSLEHIEKRQKQDGSSSSSQGGGSSKKKSSSSKKRRSPAEKRALSANEQPISVATLEKDLKEKLNLLPKSSAYDVKRPLEELGSEGDVSVVGEVVCTKSEPIDIPIFTPAMLEFGGSLSSVPDKAAELLAMNAKSFCNKYATPNAAINTRSFSPTHLLSPMDFAVPNFKQKVTSSGLPSSFSPDLMTFMSDPPCDNSNSNDILVPQKTLNGYGNTQLSSKSSSVTPLNRNQLKEALIYMLQNDEEFIIQIHECYLKRMKSQLQFMNNS